jgi:hypothetical protein
MSETQIGHDRYAIFVAALTLTRPEDWSNIRHFAWDTENINDAPPGPRYGNDVFAIIVLDHKDGDTAQVCYDLGDYVYCDYGDLHWSGPLEDDVHSLSCWSGDYVQAVEARKEGLTREANMRSVLLAGASACP